MSLLKKPPTPQIKARGSWPPVVDESGNIHFLSVSQLEKFDANVYGGCGRRWWFRYVARHPEKQRASQKLGDQAHAQLAHYLRTGEDVLGEIVRPGLRFLPKPGTDLVVEVKFGKLDWPGPLPAPIVSELMAGGVPLTGAADLLHCRGEWIDDAGVTSPDPDAFEALDHKTTKLIDDVVDPDTGVLEKKGLAKTAEQLANTWQMTGYGVLGLRRWPDKRFARLGHAYYQTQGRRAASKRSALISADQIRERWRAADALVERMKAVARTKRVEEVRPNYDACDSYGGCPHRQNCPRDISVILKRAFGGERNDQMSLLKKRQEALAKGGAAPSAPATNPAVAAELAKLQAEEKAIKTGGAAALASITPPDMPPPEKTAEPHAPESSMNIKVEASCGHTVPYSETSRLTDGTIKHIGCSVVESGRTSVAAPIVSNPPRADVPEAKAEHGTCTKIGTTVECTVDMIATKKYTCECGAEKLKIKPNKLGDGKYYALVPKHDLPTVALAKDLGAHVEASAPTPEPVAEIKAASYTPPTAAEVLGIAKIESPRIDLYLDCSEDGVATQRLEKYADDLAGTLAAEYKAMDVRCAPEGSALAFGKWRGALAAYAKAQPPAPGAYTVSATSEIAMVVFEALATLGRGRVVRGGR